MKRLSLKLTMLALPLLMAAVSSSTQSQTSTNRATTAAGPAAATDPLPAAGAPLSPASATAEPAAQGAGSNNRSYIFFRGYLFHINRSNGDPAVINAAPGAVTTSVTDFHYGNEGAFKVEAGWNQNPTGGWGFRASYFYTNQKAQENRTGATTAPFFYSTRPLNVLETGAAAAGTPATFSERFRLHVIDLEGTHKWVSGGGTNSVVVSFGVRIAPSRQTYTAVDTFVTTPESVTYTQRRTGFGPTGGIDVRHYLGGGFSWTGAGRVAFLFGKIHETATYTGVTTTSGSGTRNLGRNTPVWEGESGLEWKTPCCGGEFFVNASFIVHHWHNLINVTPTPAVGGVAFAGFDNPAAPPTKIGSIMFIGGSASLGFRF